MSVSIKFCGAAGTVTGSCALVTHPRGRVLVDCGLFQGPKTLRELNYGALPFDPQALDAVLLTHAHIDHAGLVPKLCAAGYDGKVLATTPTVDLLTWLLPDAGAIQESDVERLNRRNLRRGRPPVEPIYTRAQAELCLAQLAPVPLDQWIEVAVGVRARFWNAGHILGAASIELEIVTGDSAQRLLRVLFSGDLGPGAKAFHRDPAAPENYDYLVVEATYGDHDKPDVTADQRRDALYAEVAAALKAGGNLIIPAFAVERSQELLYDLTSLIRDGRLPAAPIFLDSPLATNATAVFEKHRDALEIPRDGKSPFRDGLVHYVRDASDSAALARITSGAIIIAGSGMCDAGRVRNHLKDNLWRSQATVLLTGYQAPGTLGALLQGGARSVRIHGEEIVVRARIRMLDVYSGHADQSGLLAWVKARLPIRRGCFLTHGEEQALVTMRSALVGLGLPLEAIIIPRLDQAFDLYPGVAKTLPPDPARRSRLDETLATAISAGRDWHNAYAAFLLDFQDRLRRAANDRSRAIVLRRVRRALEED